MSIQLGPLSRSSCTGRAPSSGSIVEVRKKLMLKLTLVRPAPARLIAAVEIHISNAVSHGSAVLSSFDFRHR